MIYETKAKFLESFGEDLIFDEGNVPVSFKDAQEIDQDEIEGHPILGEGVLYEYEWEDDGHIIITFPDGIVNAIFCD